MPDRTPNGDVELSGVYPKARETVFEAYPGIPGDDLTEAARGENNRDRILVTLLALNFLLMAFFAVLNSTAQATHAAVVTPTNASASSSHDGDASARALDEERRRAVDVLRASVARVFAPVIAAEEAWRVRAVERIGNDRVDIEVPFALFTESVYAAEGDAILEGIARVVAVGVRGYRTELAMRASGMDADVAALAERLTGYGLAPTVLSVGVLRPPAGETRDERILRFSFLLLDDDDEAVVRLTARAVPR